MQGKKFRFSTTQVILFSFISAILLGSLLLKLPISSLNGTSVPYIDALFTATTATCVTGLVTLPTFSTWSIFGQIVILILIQIGGLGIITIMSWFMISLHKKIDIGNRLLLQDAFNLESMSGLVRFVKKVVKGTFLVELIGALGYMIVFIPQFGLKGIWISVFNSISAFCNAGIDIIAEDGLAQYATNPIINFVTCSLVILCGIGFIVWWDVLKISKQSKRKWYNRFKDLSLHSKIAISTTLTLLLLGTISTFIFEYNNPLSIKEMNIFDKIQVSVFQSVTTRTAGFYTIPQQNLTAPTTVISLVLMFIGGSPVGTAGGVKTVTVLILLATAITTIKNEQEVVIFNRNISSAYFKKALAVVTTSLLTVIVSTVLLSAVTQTDFINIIYETVSATATVGLTRDLTPTLNTLGKLIIIATMYFGRVGPISLAIAFAFKNNNKNLIKHPTEKLSVG